MPDENEAPVNCQNSICRSRAKNKKSDQSSLCRGPLCRASLLGPVKVDTVGQKALNFFISDYAPSHGVLVTLKDGSNGLLSRLLPWALRDDLILDAIMAESLAYAAEGNMNTEFGTGALRFRHSAVNKIIQRLSSGCDHTILQAVICLVFTDVSFIFPPIAGTQTDSIRR